jgi:hypothetical protein
LIKTDGVDRTLNAGLTIEELATLYIERGAMWAMEHDGGSSSQLAFNDTIIGEDSGRGVVQHLLLWLGGDEVMAQTWEALVSLKVRSGPSTDYPQTQGLAIGDKVEGILDPASNWIHISRIIRVNGNIFAFDGWCSGYSGYVRLLEETPPDPDPEPEPTPTPSPDITVDIIAYDVRTVGDRYEGRGLKLTKTQ